MLFILLLSLANATAQQSEGNEDSAKNLQTMQDYRIGPGDAVTVHVFGLQDFDYSGRVSNSGKIHLPYLGSIMVNGMTLAQMEGEIAGQLRERGLVKEPWVQARMDEYRAQPVYVLGEVMMPGQFVIEDEMYLMDLITMAAGLNDVASPIGYLYRLTAPAPKIEGAGSQDTWLENYDRNEAIEINFKELYEGTRPELNMRLRGGDVLYVPQASEDKFFVVGDVGNPGFFVLPRGEHLMASQAIAKAGGPLKTAKMSKGRIIRFGKNGAQEELAMDFKAILKGKKPDITINPDDIIFIPGSVTKTIGYGLLGLVPDLAERTTEQH